jgi:histidyl-tRNA synthetase
MERLVLLLSQPTSQMEGYSLAPPADPDLYVVSRGEAAELLALTLVRRCRSAGLAAELDLSGGAFGKQFKRADRCGARRAAVIGESEAAEGVVLLKQLRGEAADLRLSPEAVVAHLLHAPGS